MPRELISITGFEHGIIEDRTLQAKNAFSFSTGIDIHSDVGYLQASQRTTLLDTQSGANGIDGNSDFIKWKRHYSKINKTFALGHSGGVGRLYAYLNAVWTKVHQDANACNGGGLEEYNDRIYWASDTNLGRTETGTLKVDINNSTTTITLNSGEISGFPSAGDLIVEDELITYSGKSGNDLTGASRGANGTTAGSHSAADDVIGFTDSSLDKDSAVINFTADDNLWHPMKIYLGKLNIGDGQYVATLESDNTWTATKLTITNTSLRIRTLEIYNDNLAIGTWEGTSINTSKAIAELFIWDGVSEVPIQALTIKEQGIHALGVWNNLLVVFAGIYGKAYIFNGSTLSPFIQVPRITGTGLIWGQVYPDAVELDIDGNLLFGFSKGSSTGDMFQIYKVGSKSSKQPTALTGAYIVSTNKTNAFYYSINNIIVSTIPRILIGFFDNDGTYGIDAKDINSKYLNYLPFAESQIYDISRNNFPTLVKGVKLVAKNLINGTIRIRYDLDANGSWLVLGKIDAQNQDFIMKGIDTRAEQIQIRLDFKSLVNVSPAVSAIKIY